MIRRIALAGCCLVSLWTTGASAGPFTDDLSRCMVRASTSQDQLVLVKWMFSAFALNPEVAPLSNITPEQREGLNQQTADLMQRLLLSDCREQTIAALKNEGTVSLQTSFSVLGAVAARGLMSGPSATAGLLGLVRHFDGAKFHDLFDDAGVDPPPIKFGQ
jgi:hypothetical protein